MKTGSVVNSVSATHETAPSTTPSHLTTPSAVAPSKTATSSKPAATSPKLSVDQKTLALVNGSAAKVAPLTFTGLDPQGIPTGFTVTDAQDHFGNINVTKPIDLVTSKGAVSHSIAVTSDDFGAYVLLSQAITNNARGTSYSAAPSVALNGSQTPLVVAATHSYVTRLSDGTYLLTATIVVNSTVNSGIISPIAHGVDISSAPTQIITRIHLSSDKSTILGQAIYIATATLGTTLAPWGLAFIQSYAVDKRLSKDDLKLLRVDVWTGSLLTGVIGFFVIVTCAATLNAHGITNITDASQAAAALKPLAGTLAKDLFAVGLIGAALLAASILPLSTAYSISDLTGRPAALDDSFEEAPLFYSTFAFITVLAAALILIPGAPLITILIISQIINAVLLLPLLLYMFGISRDKRLMGEFVATKTMSLIYTVIIAIVAVCVFAMLWYTFF